MKVDKFFRSSINLNDMTSSLMTRRRVSNTELDKMIFTSLLWLFILLSILLVSYFLRPISNEPLASFISHLLRKSIKWEREKRV